jgi:predicted Zn-dependent protease
MNRLRSLLAIALVLALSDAGCAGGGSPPPRRREVILASEAVDEKVGREASEDVTVGLGIVDDPALMEYVDQVGQRLARHAPRGRFQYHFAIIDQHVPNAFALPGGYIYISRGLLLLTNSEDELANVIGHEIVHVAARHAAARQAVIRGLPGPVQFFAQGYIAGYSRSQEHEADRLGQGLAGVAGFDPQGMATFLKELEYTERLRLGSSRMPGFFDTHPATLERVASAGGRARMVSWQRAPGIAQGRDDYLRRLEGLVVGMSAAEGVFRDERFIHPDLDFGMRFPDGWATMNTHVAVGAVSRLRDAQIVLEGQGKGDDPERAASEYLGKNENRNIEISTARPLQIGRYPAYRIDGKVGTPYGWLPIAITWIVRDGIVFRFTGVAAPDAFQRYEGAYGAVVRSFRPLTQQQRNSVSETRLHIVAAHEGENIKTLSERTGNEWDLQTTAVFNDIFATEPLTAGTLVKIAVTRPYEPRRAEHRRTGP